MLVNRRSFLGLAAAAGAAAVWSPRLALARIGVLGDAFFEWKDAGEGIKAAFGAGGNSMVVLGKDAALLVDTKNAPYGQQLRREAEALGKPLKFVVSTHHHADHTGGNHAFTTDLKVVAQEKCRPRVLAQTNRYMSQLKQGIKELSEATGEGAENVRTDLTEVLKDPTKLTAESFAPTEMFATSHEIDVGGVKVVLKHFGAGHTDNDIIAHVPERNVIHTGDLLFYKSYPYMDRDGGATTKGWRESLKGVSALCDAKTMVIPGHGELANLDGLKEQIEYFDKMTEFVAAQIKAGKTRKEVAEMNPEPYQNYARPGIRPITLGGIYDELAAEKKK